MTAKVEAIQNSFWKTLAHMQRKNVSKVGIYSVWSLFLFIILAVIGQIIGTFTIGNELGFFYVVGGLVVASLSTVGLYKGFFEKGRKKFRIPGFVINIILIAIAWWIVAITGTLLFVFVI